MDRIYGRGAGERGQNGKVTGARTWGKSKMLSTFSAPAGENWEKKTLIKVARRLMSISGGPSPAPKRRRRKCVFRPAAEIRLQGMRIDAIKIPGPVG